MFADPTTITFPAIGAVAMSRTGTGDNQSSYVNAGGDIHFRVFHTYGKRTRHVARLQFDSLEASPLISGQNITQSMTAYITVDTPPGYDQSTANNYVRGLATWLTETTGANTVKLLNGQS